MTIVLGKSHGKLPGDYPGTIINISTHLRLCMSQGK